MTKYKKIPESELILHPDGSVYHLNLKPEQLADTIILVGDPQRVEIISGHFDEIEFKSCNRELCTHTGRLNNKRLTVLSTGMGTDNIDIVLNELDALVNVDLNKRVAKEKHTTLNIIRLGTSGALQPDVPLNSFIVSEYGLGLDSVVLYYNNKKNVIDKELTEAFYKFSNWPEDLSKPYIIKGSEELAEKLGKGFFKGITATSPGFYGPQGRVVRLDLAYPNLVDTLHNFKYKDKKILNFEMETSALYGLGKMLGHNTLTICVAIANRYRLEYNNDYKIAVKELIETVLKRLTDK